jgi:carbonic anhydrase
MSRSVLFLITLICFSHFYIFVDCRQWKESCSEESREFVEYYPSGKHEKVAVKHCRNKHSTSFEEKPEPEKPEEKPIFTYGKNDPFGPSNWGLISKECDGKKQSPININTWTAKPKQGKSLKIEGIRKQASSITAQNNGHGFYIKFKYANGEPAKFVGGPLKNSYIIDNIHWHWGKRDQEGSEHTINGIRYSSEAHVVSYNSKYKTISEALKYSDGLAVLGVFYKVN